jgi:hypothetical protein
VSVRVNLLPQEAAARQEAARQRNAFIVAGLVLLLLLGLLYWWQLARVGDARDERDLAQEELQVLQAREAELAEFGDLDNRVDEANSIIESALADEISYAGVLQDLAAVMPADSALTEFDITAVEAEGPDGDEVREVIARIVASGESLEGHAPGLERLLLEMDKIVSFFDVYFTNSVVDGDDEDVVLFDFEVDVGQEARTGRYQDGVPEELR